MTEPQQLPGGLIWQERPFPDANFLLLTGDRPTMVDTGFVSHAEATQALAAEAGQPVEAVVNTHWHSDHVGGNALFQQSGAEIIGSPVDADALDRADPGCCVAEYLDQPVPRYRVDRRVPDGELIGLGQAEWQVVAVPGHTPGHLALWQADDRVLVVGDTLSSYDVGWVNIMREGVDALDTAIASMERLQELDARLVLPGHGPLIQDPAPAVAKAVDRLTRQRQDLPRAVSYGAKRVLSFALMIRDGIAADALEPYVHQRAWAQDAARTLDMPLADFAHDLVDSMISGGAVKLENGVARAAAPYTEADLGVFDLPFPKDWALPT